MPARATLRVSFGVMLLMCITCFVPRSNAQILPNVPESRVYHIGVGDVVQIDVWRQPELTRTVPVQPDGTIRFPLLDGVKAEGLTAMELATQLREKLLPLIQNPQVTVTITQINSAPPRATPGWLLFPPQTAPQLRDTPPPKCCAA